MKNFRRRNHITWVDITIGTFIIACALILVVWHGFIRPTHTNIVDIPYSYAETERYITQNM